MLHIVISVLFWLVFWVALGFAYAPLSLKRQLLVDLVVWLGLVGMSILAVWK